MSRQPRPDDIIATVTCPKCKRVHTTRFDHGEKVKDVTCRDCINERVRELEEMDRRPQG